GGKEVMRKGSDHEVSDKAEEGEIRRERFFFASRRRHTRFSRDWSSDVCSSDLPSGTAIKVQVNGSPGLSMLATSAPGQASVYAGSEERRGGGRSDRGNEGLLERDRRERDWSDRHRRDYGGRDEKERIHTERYDA